MAANMQNMAGAGHMLQQHTQQMRNPNSQVHSSIFTRLSNAPTPPMGWQTQVSVSDRMARTLDLYATPILSFVSFRPRPPARPVPVSIADHVSFLDAET